MFCQKCGTQAVDGAEFCQKCGARLVTDSKSPSMSTPTPGVQAPVQPYPQQPGTPIPSVQVPPQPYVGPVFPQKKKSKAPKIILGILGGIFGLFVLLIIIGLVADSDEADSLPNSSASSTDVNLSQSYVNEADGISFQYPSAWVAVKEEDFDDYVNASEWQTLAVLVNETKDLPEDTTYIILQRCPATPEDEADLFSSEQDFINQIQDESNTIKEAPVIELDGVACRKITVADSGGNGYTSYLYINGSYFYRIEFSWFGETPGNNQKSFDAIMDSYTITPAPADHTTSEPSNADTSSDNSSGSDHAEAAVTDYARDQILFRGIRVDDLLISSYDSLVEKFGEPDTSMYGGEELTYGNVLISFDMFSRDEPYLCSITSPDFNDFTYNGQPIPTTYDELTKLFGIAPEEDSLGQFRYSWSLAGLCADLTIATEESQVEPGITVSWWDSSNWEQPVVAPALPYGFEWVEAPYVTGETSRRVEGVIRNDSGRKKTMATIIFNMYDADGNLVGNVSDMIMDWGNGATWKFSTFSSSEAVTFEFSRLESY